MDWLPGTTGITYTYKGVAERPFHAGAVNVGYALLPIYEHWWLRSESSNAGERSFADFYTYQPFGDRPTPSRALLGGAFLGVKHAANKAKPFWGWHDGRTLQAGILARGQWGLDPAYGFTRNLRYPSELPVSLDYVFNPYLGVGAPSNMTAAQTTAISQTMPWLPARTRPAPEPLPQWNVKAPAIQRPAAQTASGESSSPQTRQQAEDGFRDLGQPVDGWGTSIPAASPATDAQPPSKEGLSGWDPAPGGGDGPGKPATQAPSTEGPRGWGTAPTTRPKAEETKPAPANPRGWGLPVQPNGQSAPKQSHD